MSTWWQGRPATLRQPPTLPEEHPFYALIGRVASEWAHLEHILDTTIWGLLGANEELAACVTSQIMGIGPRCKAILTLGFARNLHEKILAPFRKLMNDSYSTADCRARFVHDPWFVQAGTEGASQFRAMPYVDMRFGKQDIDKREVETTIKKIRDLQNRASELRKNVLSALEAL
jgi:hypothetical protein